MYRRSLAVALVLVASSLASVVPMATAGVTTRFVDDDLGSCDDSDGIPFYCTIQAAIDDSGDGDTIQVAAGTYTGTGTVVADNFTVQDLTITGAGPGLTVIDGENTRGGIRTSERNATVTGLTIRNGFASGSGAGITVQNPGNSTPYPVLRVTDVSIENTEATSDGAGILAFNRTVLHLERVTLIDNDTTTGNGGGLLIGTNAEATIVDSTFSSNDVGGAGGAIVVGGESLLEIYGSTFTANTSGDDGGAISAQSTGTTVLIYNSSFDLNVSSEDGGAIASTGSDSVLSIDTSTFSDNGATGAGGAVHFTLGDFFVATRSYFTLNSAGSSGGAIDDGTETAGLFINDTLHDNDAVGQGGGIRTSGIVANSSISANSAATGGGVATNGWTGPKIRNTILYGNSATTAGGDCYLAVSQGYNMLGDDTGCSLSGDTTGNQIGADPGWSLPADNGGPTYTMKIFSSSDAADAGNPATTGTGGFSCPHIDQRGYLRNDTRCDIGAFEADATPEVLRYAGNNRYATAAAVSAGDYPTTVTEVFIATGLNFPDALAGAAVAGVLGAPLLLVDGGIPPATAAELTRLDPDVITILGGSGAVSDAVETALGGYAPTVERISGTNRYLTAVEISQYGFDVDGSADIVYVATGLGFADALSAASAAAYGHGPVLLVDGATLNSAVSAEIVRLTPDRIVVVGGTAAVSDSVLTALDALQVGDSVERIAGNNRYSTAAAISADAFVAGSIRAYVATGLNFPDALAGAAAAGKFAAPVLLVPGTSMPTVVSDEITRLGAPTVVILGGTAVVSSGVEDALETLIGAS